MPSFAIASLVQNMHKQCLQAIEVAPSTEVGNEGRAMPTNLVADNIFNGLFEEALFVFSFLQV